jgi:hypothetical protein
MRPPLFMKLLKEFLQLADQEAENLSDDMTKLVSHPPRRQRNHRLASP